MNTLEKNDYGMSFIGSREKAVSIFNLLKEKKAGDIVVMDISRHADFADFLIVASASSSRHARALAEDIASQNKEEKKTIHMEGYSPGEWILLDLNDVIVNIFHPDMRRTFNLEGLWNNAPVVKHYLGVEATENKTEDGNQC